MLAIDLGRRARHVAGFSKISSIWPAASRRQLGEIVGEDEGAIHQSLNRNGVNTVARQMCKAGLPIVGMAPRRAVASERPCFGTARRP